MTSPFCQPRGSAPGATCPARTWISDSSDGDVVASNANPRAPSFVVRNGALRIAGSSGKSCRIDGSFGFFSAASAPTSANGPVVQAKPGMPSRLSHGPCLSGARSASCLRALAAVSVESKLPSRPPSIATMPAMSL